MVIKFIIKNFGGIVMKANLRLTTAVGMAKAIQELNPRKLVMVTDPSLTLQEFIAVERELDDILLPEGFYFQRKYEDGPIFITNKEPEPNSFCTHVLRFVDEINLDFCASPLSIKTNPAH